MGRRNQPHQVNKPSFLSQFFFCFMIPTFWSGSKRDLNTEDLGTPLDTDLSEPLGDKLEANWKRELEKSFGLKKRPRFLRAVVKTFIGQYLFDGFLVFFQYIVCKSFQPLLLAALLRYFNAPTPGTPQMTRNEALLNAGGVIALSVASVFIQHHTTFRQQRLGMRVRIACCSLIYRKMLCLGTSSLAKTTAGQLVNLMSNDVCRFDSALKFLHILWVAPIQIALCCYLYYESISSVALLGVACTLLQTLPVQSYISKMMSRLRLQIAQRTDERVRQMDEIISGIQVLKMYAWENAFEKTVAEARNRELRYVKKASCLKAVNASFLIFTERSSLYITLFAHVLLGYSVDASTVYSLTQFYNMLQTVLGYVYPNAVTTLGECLVSIKRIQNFLMMDEKTGSIENTIRLQHIYQNDLKDKPFKALSVTHIGKDNLGFENVNGKFIGPNCLLEKLSERRLSLNSYQFPEYSIELKGITASWNNNTKPTLNDISFKIRPGSLCLVIGCVGAGKSSILQLLLKELPYSSGNMIIHGDISYASQEPWLFVATIRNNILFGQSYDPKKYREVVRVCALEKDFQQFPRGDQTLVGERGVSLSGGQRARINLARAVYRQADIYLLDDPLSGVDVPVSSHLFNSCILSNLKGKTRILVTHQIHYLKSADYIIFVKDGKIESAGTYKEFKNHEKYLNGETNLQSPHEVPSEKKFEKIYSGGKIHKEISRRGSVASIDDYEEEEMDGQEEVSEVLAKGRMKASVFWKYWKASGSRWFLFVMIAVIVLGQLSASASDYWVNCWTNQNSQEVLMQTRQLEQLYLMASDDNLGASNSLLNYQWKSNNGSHHHHHHQGSHVPHLHHHVSNVTAFVEKLDDFNKKLPHVNLTEVLTNTYRNTNEDPSKRKKSEILLKILGSPEIKNASEIYSNSTAAREDHGTQFVGFRQLLGHLTTEHYLIVYSVLIAACVILTITGSMFFFKVCMKSSEGLHNQVFKKVLNAKMRFFNTNPSGRILNRFSKDMGVIDELLPKDMMEALQVMMFMANAFVMVSITNTWLLIPTAVILLLFYALISFYLTTAQNIKRLEGVTRSPVFSHACGSIKGISTIRSCNGEARLAKEFDSYQDLHTAAWYSYLASRSTLGFWLDVVCTLFVTCVTFTFIIYNNGTVLSGDVGLAISQSLILTSMLQFGVRQATEVVSHLTSVERLLQYIDIEQEDGLHFGDKPTPMNWPNTGTLIMKNVTLSYSDNDGPVLKDLNVHIQSGWKVGIVGRTGAGKSSLISALFRLAKVEGSVNIDGVDINKIALQDLRSRISIIPQEPILFSSTMRRNLDPYEIYEDASLWHVLEEVDLKSSVPSLDFKVSEGGSNFSLGQRQLVCLARAILKNNKILILDEATASLDPQTDFFIQQIIRKKFSHCTVLTIAHRLNTIMDADRILVMEAGHASEFGHPHELLSNIDGRFRKMVKETGRGMAATLHEIARLTFERNVETINPSLIIAQKDIEDMSYENNMSDGSGI